MSAVTTQSGKKESVNAFNAFIIDTTVFITGACIMILELVGSRVVAPHIGSSLIVWTALISTIMGSLGLGYWWGGLWADRNPSRKILSLVLLGAGISVGWIKPLELYLISGVARYITDIRLASLCIAVLLFAVPSVLLGMVSPYALKLRLTQFRTAGSVSGRLWALSTFGSITGTLLAGFVLIAFVGHNIILYGIAFVLMMVSLAVFPIRKERQSQYVMVAFLSLGISWLALPVSGHKDIDTVYNRVQIIDIRDPRTGRQLRGIQTDPQGYQTLNYIDGEKESVGYISWFKMVTHFQPSMNRVLVIGGAGYSLPRELFRWRPNLSVDVAEVDPGMTKVAKEYFDLKESLRLSIYHEDGRMFLTRNTSVYDALFLDAYGSAYVPPHHLITREAMELMARSLRDGGGLYVNAISSLAGTKSAIFRSMYATVRSVFPTVYIFSEAVNRDEYNIHNIILVGIKGSRPAEDFSDTDPVVSRYLSQRYVKEFPEGRIFTDSYVPIEYLALQHID